MSDSYTFALEADVERVRASRAEARIMVLASENLAISEKLSAALFRSAAAEAEAESARDASAASACEGTARMFSLYAENEALSARAASLRTALDHCESNGAEMSDAIYLRNDALASARARADAGEVETQELRSLCGDLAEEVESLRARLTTVEASLVRSRGREVSLAASLAETDAALAVSRAVGTDAMVAADAARSANRAAVKEAREATAALATSRAQVLAVSKVANINAAAAAGRTADAAARTALDTLLNSTTSVTGSGSVATPPFSPYPSPSSPSPPLSNCRLEESRSAALCLKLELEVERGARAALLQRAEAAEEGLAVAKRETTAATACTDENKASTARAVASETAALARIEDAEKAVAAASLRADTLADALGMARRAAATSEAEKNTVIITAMHQVTAREAALLRAASAEAAAAVARQESREARMQMCEMRSEYSLLSSSYHSYQHSRALHANANANANATESALLLDDSLAEAEADASASFTSMAASSVRNASPHGASLSPASGLRQDLARLNAVLLATHASLNTSWVE